MLQSVLTQVVLHAPSGALTRRIVLVLLAAAFAVAPLAAGAEPVATDNAAAYGEHLCGWY